MHRQVLLGLCIRHAAIPDQPNSLKLELPRKLPPLHDAPPVPLKHLTWCLRNRVQANSAATEKNEAKGPPNPEPLRIQRFNKFFYDPVSGHSLPLIGMGEGESFTGLWARRP